MSLASKNPLRRIIALGLILLGLSLLLVVALSLFERNPGSEPGSGAIPNRLAGLALSQKQTGSAAVAHINRLHGLDFRLKSGAVGVYGRQASLTLWAAGASSQEAAAGFMEEMRAEIARGDTPFSPVTVRFHNGYQVYELTGLGQTYFYFQSGRWILWLAAPEGLAEHALDDLIWFYQSRSD